MKRVNAYPKIKIVGIGGAGISVVNRIIESSTIKGIEFITIATSEKMLKECRSATKIKLRRMLPTCTLGMSMEHLGGQNRKAAKAQLGEIVDALGDVQVMILLCGLGGITGSFVSPVIVEHAKNIGASVIVIMMRPFSWESPSRKEIAEKQRRILASKADVVVEIPNDDLILRGIENKKSFGHVEMYTIADEMMCQSVRSIVQSNELFSLCREGMADADHRKKSIITKNQIDRALPRIINGLKKYIWIQEQSVLRDVSTNREFQKRFNGFYRIRGRTVEWKKEFYRLLEINKSGNPNFEKILTELFHRVGRVEASFVSKLVATIDPNMPVIDKIILNNLELNLPAANEENRIVRISRLYQRLRNYYLNFLQTENGRYLIKRFSDEYPNAKISKIKMLDFVLWQTRDS